MDITVNENYIHTCFLGLDVQTLYQSSLLLYDVVLKSFDLDQGAYKGRSTLSTKVFNLYNVFFYPFDGFHELFLAIREAFRACNYQECTENKYYIQCWLNVYKKDDFINWHSHWLPKYKSWHGFYCVNAGTSCTSYCLPGNHIGQSDVQIQSKNDLLVLSRSDGDKHKSSEWVDELVPRITIAFDIVPAQYLTLTEESLSHWIPF
jgi:hypothetical protein